MSPKSKSTSRSADAETNGELLHLFAADLFGRHGAVCIRHCGCEYLLTRNDEGLALLRVKPDAMPV